MAQQAKMARRLRRILLFPVLVAAALVILFEELAWDELAALASRLARWSPIARLEARITRLSPLMAVVVFFVPGILLLPVKLAAVWCVAAGHAFLGIAVIVLAKIAGTALVARLFALTRPQLMTVGWFARLYNKVIDFKTILHRRLRALAPWRAIQSLIRTIQSHGRGSGGISRLLRRLVARWRRSPSSGKES